MAATQPFYTAIAENGESHFSPSIPKIPVVCLDSVPFVPYYLDSDDDGEHESERSLPHGPLTTRSIADNYLGVNMVKKRSSLQSLFTVPSFLHPSSVSSDSPATSRMRSATLADFPYRSSGVDMTHSAAVVRDSNSPPADLIDDDPFANLCSPRETARAVSASSQSSPPRSAAQNPRSPLSPTFGLVSSVSGPAAPQLMRTSSSGRVHPAHQKPAFRPRPSLPSLHTLAMMNVVLTQKVRKGRVGAGLPLEPWNDQPDEPVASGSGSPMAPTSSHFHFFDADLSDDDTDHHELFSASPEDEDIDVGLDYSPLEFPHDDISPPPSRTGSSDLGHSYSASTSSISSIESFGEEIFYDYSDASPEIFPSYDYSVSAASAPDDFIPFQRASWQCSPTPPSSIYLPNDPDIVESGSSVDTITLRSFHRSSIMSRTCEWLSHDYVDSDNWDGRGRGTSRRGDLGGSSANSSGGGDKREGNGETNAGAYNGGNGDDRRGDKPRRGLPTFSATSSSEESESEDEYRPVGQSTDDDDVPLAQRIPTALKAQRTIRLKAREERDQRRKEHAAARSRQATLRPAGAGAPVMTSSQEAALHATKSIRRPRTQTISGTGSRMPFAVEELAQRLQSVQAIEPTRLQGRERVRSASPEISVPKQALRPMRSFHRPEHRRVEDHQTAPMPQPELPRRTNTRAKSRTREDGAPPRARGISSPMSDDDVPAVPAMPRRSIEERATTKLLKPRTSTEQGNVVSSPPLILSKGTVSQQRIFIGDRQRFNMVEIAPSTNAGQVLDMIEAQGSLKGWVGTGGWMLFEVAQDFGMERPIRSFELLSDVEASWNKDKMVNIFVAKLTPLAVVLRRSAIPSGSPVFSGWVEWEIKRGKWTKRWMTLREHSLFLSKRDNGRDETLLCSLSNFDAYNVTRVHKSPKPYVFSVKSTDNISFFENTADYLHIFCCSKPDGEVWMEKILLARSYVLHQERNILFNPKAAGGNSAGSALSRAPTARKGSTSHHARSPSGHHPLPTQTLLDVHRPQLFEPGSLLNK